MSPSPARTVWTVTRPRRQAHVVDTLLGRSNVAKGKGYTPTSKPAVPNVGRTFGTMKHGAKNQQAGAPKGNSR